MGCYFNFQGKLLGLPNIRLDILDLGTLRYQISFELLKNNGFICKGLKINLVRHKKPFGLDCRLIWILLIFNVCSYHFTPVSKGHKCMECYERVNS